MTKPTQTVQDIQDLAHLYYDKKLGLTSLYVLLTKVEGITPEQIKEHYQMILGYAPDHVNQNAGCLDHIQKDIHTSGKFSPGLHGGA